MPVEIRELVIKAYIEPEEKKEVAPSQGKTTENEEVNQPFAEMVGQILEIVNNKNER